ncbi:asparagine synthase (glutamine-hydrolysing) [Roseibium hamelinense]|uniref:asparagine synthase (glutamine-hydrolyzing) n=1 Tax=Roseibium hamelinense TaxID=150831 RepID=A0A562TIV6_9HYPH|nr:N-acetylglutaminylglutamine amidotransferase [Roseibium hamelinense]MTI45949.1 N-acetylglutaminylglutamine amidotransferase [Roseibium hamelinense]TWI92866.1 asparagine synthase (glutamine-hydrolysing) [Roseibium hamelinense]
MCGICGEVVFGTEQADTARVDRMAQAMAARGPDAMGVTMRGRVAFGHRRLKIIDLSDQGAQPMQDPQLGLSLVFNGCIYNYQDLRKELIEKGYSFFSTSDTEVILKAWAEWGKDCFSRFHGMFAVAIHEHDSGRLHLARDRFGIKPLYFSETNKRLAFASSLPALLAGGHIDTSIDKVALNHYMSWHAVVPAPRTILNGVRKMPAATVRSFEADGTSSDFTYWAPSFEKSSDDINRSADEWRDMVLDGLRTAVRRRMVADVPVGVLLSGGVDSSLIVGLLAEEGQKGLATFSIGFEEANGEKGDEFQYSDLIADHYSTNHNKIFIPSSELQSNLPGAIGAMSEPMVSYDNIGFYLLSREVSKHIKVVQSGQGADEVFAGYHWYPKLTGSNAPAADYANAFFDRTEEQMTEAIAPEHRCARDESLAFVEEHFKQLGAEDPVDKALRLDTNVMLVDDPVKRVDNHSMAWGLEARVPFLDHELVELAGRIPAEHKLAHDGKGVLKEAARLVVPSAVIDRPKGYFPVPALKYIQGDYLDLVRDTLTNEKARSRGLFNTSYLEKLFADPTKYITKLRGSELWQVALLEMWLQAQEV